MSERRLTLEIRDEHGPSVHWIAEIRLGEAGPHGPVRIHRYMPTRSAYHVPHVVGTWRSPLEHRGQLGGYTPEDPAAERPPAWFLAALDAAYHAALGPHGGRPDRGRRSTP